MAGFFNNFYYGKAGKADFTPDQLPTNRVQLFFDMLRVRFTGLFGLNLLYILFCVPAIVWTIINIAVLNTVVADPATAQGAMGLIVTYLLGMIPCLGIAGIGAPGMMYVLRNWARDQHSFVMSDFKDALKGNWKQGLAVGLFNGLSLLLMYVCYMYYGQMAASSLFWVVPQMFCVVVGAVWWMMNMVIYPMMVTYDMKLSQLLRNSAIIVLARLPWSLLFLVGSLLVPLVCFLFIPHVSAMLVGGLIYLLVGFALTGFVYASYANSCFDRFLNPRIEGAQVNQGLRDPSLDDFDDEEDASEPPEQP